MIIVVIYDICLKAKENLQKNLSQAIDPTRIKHRFTM